MRLLPLATVPLAALDPGWDARVRAAPPPTRAALLAEADALRRGGRDDDSWRALATYRALVDEALAGTESLARAVWMAAEDPTCDATTRRFAAHAETAPGDDGMLAVCAGARCTASAAELAGSARRLLALLGGAAGRVDAVGFHLAFALADVYLRQRRELEALVAARRAFDVARAAPDLSAVDRAHAAAVVARALVGLSDLARLVAHLPAMLAAADALPPVDRDRARAHAHLLVARVAVDVGHLDEAEHHLILAREGSTSAMTLGGWGPAILVTTALRLAVAGRDAVALEELLGVDGPIARDGRIGELGVEVGRVALAAIRGEASVAADLARAVLERLRTHPSAPATRLHLAADLARALGGVPSLSAVAAHAWRAAADAALLRLVELDRSVRELRALGPTHPADLDALAAHRARFVETHQRMLAHLRDRLGEASVRDALPAWARIVGDDLVVICAWCLSVRDGDGVWLPVGHLVHGVPSLPATHGICARCLASGIVEAEGLRAAATAATATAADAPRDVSAG